MPDLLSVAASIVGITVPALHGTRLLLDDLNKIVDAPNVVQTLREDIASVGMALQSLQTIKDPEWENLGETIANQSKATIRNCERLCSMFRGNLQRWTKHSEGRLSWHDRAKVGFFKERQIKAMSEQLQSCKIAFNSAVGTATLYSSIRHTHITEEIRKTISTNEAEISKAITLTASQLADVEAALREARLTVPTHDQGQNNEDIISSVKQVEEEQAALSCSRKLLEELLSKAREDVIAKAASESQERLTRVTFGNNNSGFQVGIINGPISGISFGGK
ncbi:uncharacterized protein BDZ99DRAFT_422403 [Mytilinidion resinicola]|uniref:Azaphilone pigments biosynthesis cluster protein L N-terminal domain-containing protein n=1 Tax=Mytilinidion resinicola TaxID=574789 RepID=A0A6A6YDY0_9PEZI|nr:uncharacterized protein BDZ99DRAFT_422403 [Mytilinidion resinicola]KAF2807031.1 hypothetical protein BDZ99DRAFT_422403 [Mytilinidion resinicola]